MDEPSWAEAKSATRERDRSRAEAQLDACFEAVSRLAYTHRNLRDHLQHVRCERPQVAEEKRISEIDEVASEFVDRLRQLERAINAEVAGLNELRAELEV